MTNPISPAPDTVSATGDPGDETAQRYRYQWTYAAIICCSLLDETQDVTEVFCEHHEDVLMKHSNGTFSGLQIKTRASNQPVWKTTDDAVIKSCSRFVKLEAEYPDYFTAFKFLTNHPLYSAENVKDIRYFLEKISTVESVSDLSNQAQTLIKRIANEAGYSEEISFKALSKTKTDDNLPKLSDITSRLIHAITHVWSPAATDISFSSVQHAANMLVSECQQASSLAHQDVLPAYLPTMNNKELVEVTKRIAGKCFNLSRLKQVLQEGLTQSLLLDGENKALVLPCTASNDILRKKLEAGGFSIVSYNSATDLRSKAEYLGIKWLNKYDSGSKQYHHICSLVLRDAADAFEETKNENHHFGFQMLQKLRSHFSQRRSNGENLFNCSNEHLEGFAYSLTAECKVQWSINRPWEGV